MHSSNIELTLLAFLTLMPHALGNEDFFVALGYIGSTWFETPHPYRLLQCEKSVDLEK
jgi:hypothetical protein